jgi:hypothetical protein
MSAVLKLELNCLLLLLLLLHLLLLLLREHKQGLSLKTCSSKDLFFNWYSVGWSPIGSTWHCRH